MWFCLSLGQGLIISKVFVYQQIKNYSKLTIQRCPQNSNCFSISVSQPSLDQSGRGSLSSYYDSGSSKEGGPQYGHTQPRPQPEPISHPVITNNSPALVAQALSGRDPCQKQYFNIGMGYQDNLVTITKK